MSDTRSGLSRRTLAKGAAWAAPAVAVAAAAPAMAASGPIQFTGVGCRHTGNSDKFGNNVPQGCGCANAPSQIYHMELAVSSNVVGCTITFTKFEVNGVSLGYCLHKAITPTPTDCTSADYRCCPGTPGTNVSFTIGTGDLKWVLEGDAGSSANVPIRLYYTVKCPGQAEFSSYAEAGTTGLIGCAFTGCQCY